MFKTIKKDNLIQITLSSETSMVERAVGAASDFVEQIEKQRDEGGCEFPELAQALRELLINAVVHGNKKQAGKLVECQVARLEDDIYMVTVTDDGTGFDHRNQAALTSPAPVWEGKSGFGLIRSICDQIEFNEAGNQASAYLRRPRRTSYKVSLDGNHAIIRPGGSVTAASAPDLKQKLAALIDAGATRYSFDFEKVAEIDSMSLTVFVVFVKTLMKQNIKAELEIFNSSSNIKKLFALTRLDSHYKMV